MKISLIHCYSDFNKGDLGIILSTIEALKKVYPDADINAISTYNYNDSQYKNDHRILTKYIDKLYPSIFGLMMLKFRDKEYKSGLAKLIKYAVESIRFKPLLFLPRGEWMLRTLLNCHEYRTFEALRSSDIIISKGGSFICNEDNWRSKIAYRRLMYIFRLLKKYKIPYFIFGQSLGPVYGKKSIKILNEVLAGSKVTYLREKECLNQYPYIDGKFCSDIIVNDTAFTMTRSEAVEFLSDEAGSTLKVGVTIKLLYKNHSSYKNMLLGAFQFLIDKHDAKIFIFPQVTVDKDMNYAIDIYKALDDRYKQNIYILSNNYTPYELRYGYSKMKFLIGTRLHSTIFAMSAGIPAINISYHGTKSQGIYENMGVAELVIEPKNFHSKYLIDLIDNVLANYDIYVDTINQNRERYRSVMIKEIQKMQ